MTDRSKQRKRVVSKEQYISYLQLPEPESLVRASSEPPIEQSDVLLRAAQSVQETPAEQLLRPFEQAHIGVRFPLYRFYEENGRG